MEEAQKVDELLPKLYDMVGSGLIDIQDTTILKPAGPSKATEEKPAPPLKLEGKAKLMRIFVGESDKWREKPLYKALVEGLRANDIAGVTVYRGIAGYGANRRVRKDAPLGLSQDSPIVLSVVDNEEKLRRFIPVLDDMVTQGLVVLSDVDIIKYTHDFTRQDRRREPR